MTQAEIEYVEEIKALKEKVVKLQEFKTDYISAVVAESAYGKLQKEIKALKAENEKWKSKAENCNRIAGDNFKLADDFMGANNSLIAENKRLKQKVADLGVALAGGKNG